MANKKLNMLLNKLENKAAEVEKLEAAYMRLTISRVLTLGKAERISANIVTLMAKVEEIGKKRAEAKELEGEDLNEAGKDILQSFLDFAFKHEKALIYGIIADVFDIDTEDVEHVPLSCIYECIMKDKVLLSFLPRLAVLDARAQFSTLPNAAPSQPLPPTPSTSNQGPKGKILTKAK